MAKLVDWAKSKGTHDLEAVETVQETLTDSRPGSESNLDLALQFLAALDPQVKRFLELTRPEFNQPMPAATELRNELAGILSRQASDRFVSNHLKLELSRWQIEVDRYDEALGLLQSLRTQDVLAPESLLYYRGLVQHQLLKKQDCLQTAERLLENAEQLPRRYEALARLWMADIQGMETDSLDEVSRLMSDIQRRTELHRSGTVVLQQEQLVLEKLDKLIEELESQQQQQNNSSESSGPASKPMEKTQAARGRGTGEVQSKRQADGGDWGSLPPAERAAALAEMTKDLPPHYRDVIEEYFRQLAKEE